MAIEFNSGQGDSAGRGRIMIGVETRLAGLSYLDTEEELKLRAKRR